MAAHIAFGQTDAAKVLALFQAAGDDELVGQLAGRSLPCDGALGGRTD
jgi:hypothetical protein